MVTSEYIDVDEKGKMMNCSPVSYKLTSHTLLLVTYKLFQQGLGMVTSEYIDVDEKGKMMNCSPVSYKLTSHTLLLVTYKLF